jgi:ATP-dependent Lon protease
VGGVREKVIAAHRNGLKIVIIPKLNMKDLIDVPKRARSEMKIIPVEHIDEVLSIALEKEAQKPKASRSRKKADVKEEQQNSPAKDAAIVTGANPGQVSVNP